jgi:Fe-S-cluster containining protein
MGTGVLTWLHRLVGIEEKTGSRCRGCGQCCELFGGNLRASARDRQRWQQEGRKDLLERVNHLGWIWIDPATNTFFPRCPYLQRIDAETAHCTIHATKPEMCQAYPTLAHARCIRGIPC